MFTKHTKKNLINKQQKHSWLNSCKKKIFPFKEKTGKEKGKLFRHGDILRI